ncbi:MAG: DUF3108 domain-containing protein [Alphaproteobacteria bacterium]
MCRVLLAGFIWLLATGTVGSAAAVASERLVLSYELWKGGFHALDLEAGLSQDSKDYNVKFVARTRGFIGWIYPYLLEGEADGKLAGAGLRPTRFATLAKSRNDERSRAISYLEDGTLRTWSDPPRTAEDDEASVPERMRRGTLDPASAILALVDAAARDGRCDGNYPVYDGRRRYDLTISLIGPSPLAPNRYSSYSGPATLCRVIINKMSGFRDKAKRGGMPDAIKIWLAPVADTKLAVPVRLEGTSDLGNLIIHLIDSKVESESAEAAERRSAAR